MRRVFYEEVFYEEGVLRGGCFVRLFYDEGVL